MFANAPLTTCKSLVNKHPANGNSLVFTHIANHLHTTYFPLTFCFANRYMKPLQGFGVSFHTSSPVFREVPSDSAADWSTRANPQNTRKPL
jgi:hypothetical protein